MIYEDGYYYKIKGQLENLIKITERMQEFNMTNNYDFWQAYATRCEISNKDEKIKKLEADNVRLMADNERLAASVAKSKEENRVLTKVLASSYEGIKNQTDTIERLNQQVKDLKKRLGWYKEATGFRMKTIDELKAEIAELTSTIEDISVNNDRLEDRVDAKKAAMKKKDEVIAVYRNLLHEKHSQNILNSNNVNISIVCSTLDGDHTVKARGMIRGASYTDNVLKSIDIKAKELTYSID